MLMTQFLNATRVIRRGANIRCLNATSTPKETEQSPLLRLRQKTGLAYSLCREALNKHNNNVDEAESWLKAQALAHGLQKATKVSGRKTREGLIGLSIQQGNSIVNAIELNCETDFVARNQFFKDFALDLTAQLSVGEDDGKPINSPQQDHIECVRISDHVLESANVQIVPLIAKLGENIRISRAYRFRVPEGNQTRLFGKIHASVGQTSTGVHNIMAGRFGALVGLDLSANHLNDERIQVNGARLCQHVIGYNPTYIELPDKVRKHLEEAEKERAAAAASDAGGADDDEFSEDESVTKTQNVRDDWPSIMDQTLIMSEDTPVREFCKENQMSIVYFKRFECGVEE